MGCTHSLDKNHCTNADTDAKPCIPIRISKDSGRTMYSGIKQLFITPELNFDFEVLPAFFQLEVLVIDLLLHDYMCVLVGDNFLDKPLVCPSIKEIYFFCAIHWLDDFDFLKICFPNLRRIGVRSDQISTKLRKYCSKKQHCIDIFHICYSKTVEGDKIVNVDEN